MISLLLPERAATNQTLGHPAAGIIGWFDNTSNASGVSVTHDTALTFAAVWCAVRVISETLATLPCILYRKTSDDSRQRAVDDDRYWLVHDEPHPLMNACTWFESQTADLLLSGNCYSKMIPNGFLKASRFEPRSADTVRVEIVNNTLQYKIINPPETIEADEMHHVLGLGGDGLTGWSVVRYAQQSIGAALAGDQYSAGMYGSGQTLSGILQIPTRLDKAAREQLRTEWDETHKGAAKSGRIAIMHGGMEFKPTSMSNEDAQFLQSRQFSIREIARWFRLPPHMLADLQDSSVRANIEQQAIEFIVYSLRPWLVRWQQTLNRKLLTREERQAMYFEFLLDALLAGDTPSRNAAYATARQWGWMSVNDIRRRENMNTIDGGDIYLQPGNMIEAGTQPVVPDTISREFKANVVSIIDEVKNVAKQIQADITLAGLAAGDAMAEADRTCRTSLAEARETAEAIKQDIAGLGKAHSRGWTDERQAVQEACQNLFREHMACMLRIEKAEVTKAARSVARGHNFLGWLEQWYPQHAARMAEKAIGIAAVLSRINPASTPPAYPWDAWCIRHKSQLIEASDGNPETFADRVQVLVSSWDEEVKDAKLS